MDPHEVPRGGPGLNSTNPCDSELYVKGHIEVPNLLGNDMNCSPNEYGVGGYGTSSSDAMGISSSYETNGIPPGAIVPGETPIVVGEGVTVEAPKE
jgi:pilus assembly protein CpaC